MVRPMVGIKPMTTAERQRRFRQRQREPLPEPTPEELLKKARHEIWVLQRENGRLRAEAAERARSDYHLTAPLHGEIKRLKELLEQHGITDPWKKP